MANHAKWAVEYMESRMSVLSPRDQKVLRLYIGSEAGRKHTLAEIGKELGISTSRVQQIKERAMRKVWRGYNYPHSN